MSQISCRNKYAGIVATPLIAYRSNLSLRSIGLFSWLCSHSARFVISHHRIQTEFNIGKDLSHKLVRELKDAGFLDIEQQREKGKVTGYVWRTTEPEKSYQSPDLTDSGRSATRVLENQSPDLPDSGTDGPLLGKTTKKEEREEHRKRVERAREAPATHDEDLKALGVGLEVWIAFQATRKSLKKPMTAHAETLMIKTLHTLQNQNIDPTEALELCILNSWMAPSPKYDAIAALAKDADGETPRTISPKRGTDFALINQLAFMLANDTLSEKARISLKLRLANPTGFAMMPEKMAQFAMRDAWDATPAAVRKCIIAEIEGREIPVTAIAAATTATAVHNGQSLQSAIFGR